MAHWPWPPGPALWPILTLSSSCMSLCLTFLPGLTNIPKHLSTLREVRLAGKPGNINR